MACSSSSEPSAAPKRKCLARLSRTPCGVTNFDTVPMTGRPEICSSDLASSKAGRKLSTNSAAPAPASNDATMDINARCKRFGNTAESDARAGSMTRNSA